MGNVRKKSANLTNWWTWCLLKTVMGLHTNEVILRVTAKWQLVLDIICMQLKAKVGVDPG